MAKKLRINVVCSSRDKRFLISQVDKPKARSAQVLAEKEWTLATFREHTEDIFHLLYPEEPQLRISSLQNEFHFDLPLRYQVDEALIDTGLVFLVEEEVSLLESLSQVSTAETNLKKHKYTNKRRDDSTKPSPRKRKKVIKKTSESGKIHTRHQVEMTDCSSNDRVTSTTSPTLTEQEASLTPQIVEKMSEDSVVDVESVDDSMAQTLQQASTRIMTKRKATRRKTSQQLLRKARKMKNKTKHSTKYATNGNQ